MNKTKALRCTETAATLSGAILDEVEDIATCGWNPDYSRLETLPMVVLHQSRGA